MKLAAIKLCNRDDRKVRDHLYDLIGEGGLTAFITRYVDEVFNWKSEENRRMRRFKWCMATIHTRAELEAMVRQRLSLFNLGVDAGGGGVAFSGGSVEHTTADLCDMALFSDLDLSYGEAIDVASFDSRAEAESYAGDLNDQGISNSGAYGSDGDFYVVSDPNPND